MDGVDDDIDGEGGAAADGNDDSGVGSGNYGKF